MLNSITELSNGGKPEQNLKPRGKFQNRGRFVVFVHMKKEYSGTETYVRN